MTRGQIAIITPDGRIKTSVEFNGDMYYFDNGNGETAYDGLQTYVDSEEAFEQFVLDFNEDCGFEYEGKLTHEVDDSYLDMKVGYFNKWFSDYIYIKNLSEEKVKIIDLGGDIVEMEQDDVFVFNFGQLYARHDVDLQYRCMEEKLLEIKSNLGVDEERNYSEIWNACADFDNNHRGSYLCDRIMEQDFIDDSIVTEMVKSKSDDVNCLRNFLGDTNDAVIYKLDGYGNLQNVDSGDFEDLIDEILYTVREGLPEMKEVPYM